MTVAVAGMLCVWITTGTEAAVLIVISGNVFGFGLIATPLMLMTFAVEDPAVRLGPQLALRRHRLLRAAVACGSPAALQGIRDWSDDRQQSVWWPLSRRASDSCWSRMVGVPVQIVGYIQRQLLPLGVIDRSGNNLLIPWCQSCSDLSDDLGSDEVRYGDLLVDPPSGHLVVRKL